ncbi:hypothetical protein [Ewingella americana]|uniref:Uncharacterized protein n=1 Tax=Ewingella americana TaxID=41202 RepID=A0A377NER9_9GAMM|nr:hypothetical protein [Ewingella americana]KAA8729821.1 hypothetical protein F4W05_06355 [Ewingella americana]STQ44587.1 Uncharacterised protein [Ewingella americana]
MIRAEELNRELDSIYQEIQSNDRHEIFSHRGTKLKKKLIRIFKESIKHPVEIKKSLLKRNIDLRKSLTATLQKNALRKHLRPGVTRGPKKQIRL